VKLKEAVNFFTAETNIIQFIESR